MIIDIIRVLILAPAAFFVSYWFPDIDLIITIPGIIVHRSMITHSFLIVFIFARLLAHKEGWVYSIVIFCAASGLALHLIPDMFPNSWRGYALIHVPLYGKINGIPSFIWLLFCVIVGFRYIFDDRPFQRD